MLLFYFPLVAVSPLVESPMIPAPPSQQYIIAQNLIPANDGTNTIVTPAPSNCTQPCTTPTRFDITGGQVSGDNRNLFHSFSQFNLSENQIANFIANPALANILTRIVSNNPSMINGLIQVTGGSPNLFLMNPAGVIFGDTARLDVPGSFTVTTANSIGFGNQTWFNAVGTNDWSTLIGTPQEFRFDPGTPGTLINSGILQVPPGQSLTLLGSSVINTGTLSAPGGNITIASVPGAGLVRISQANHLLSLELPANSSETSPISLPEMLTGTSTPVATDVSIVNNQVVLTHTPPAGTTLTSGFVDVSAPLEGAGGIINLLGTSVTVTDGILNASGAHGGGIIRIGGDFQGQGITPTAQITTLHPQSQIFANALKQGAGGRVIVWGDQNTQFSGTINAQGESMGGFVEVSGRDQLQFRGQVDVSATSGIDGTLLLDPTDITIVDTEEIDNPDLIDDNTINADDGSDSYTISRQILQSLEGNILLEATNDITLENGLSLAFNNGGNDITFTADADEDGSGSFRMDPRESIFAPSSNITISGATITVGGINTVASDFSGGDITLTATNGEINTGLLDSSSDFENGGNISLMATGNILSQGMISFTFSGIKSGNITLDSGGSIQTGILLSNAGEGEGGNVSLNAVNDIMVQSISSFSSGNSKAGNISLTSTEGNIDTTEGPLDASSELGDGGNIALVAQGNLNTGTIRSQSNGEGFGGAILLESVDGNITTGQIQLGSQGDVDSGDLMVEGTKTIDLTAGIINGGAGVIIGNDETQSNTILLPNNLSTNRSDITIFTQGNFSLEDPIFNTNGGQFSIFSTGTITLSGMGEILTNGGLINLMGQEIVAQTINFNSSNPLGTGGNITATAEGAGVALGNLDSSGEAGGKITVTAMGEIRIGTINTQGTIMAGGNLDFTSSGNLILGDIITRSEVESGGNVTANAGGNINLGNVNTFGNVFGGNIQATSQLGSIGTGTLLSGAQTNNGGQVILTAPEAIQIAGDINTSSNANGGAVTLTSENNTLEITGNLDSSSTGSGIGGSVFLSSDLNLRVNDLNTSARGAGGNINLLSRTGNILTGTLNASSTEFGNGGTIGIDAGETLITGNIFSQSNNFAGGNINLQSQNSTIETGVLSTTGVGAGGNVLVAAETQITTGEINTSSILGNGGNVTLDPTGDIQVMSINSTGGGTGGAINIQTQRFFRATSTFTDFQGNTASLSSAGVLGGGAITIAHGGGNTTPRTPFIIGDATVNGTAGTINTTSTTLTPRQEFPGPFTQGNLTLITQDLPPTTLAPTTPEPPTTVTPQIEGAGDIITTADNLSQPITLDSELVEQVQEFSIILNRDLSDITTVSNPESLNTDTIPNSPILKDEISPEISRNLSPENSNKLLVEIESDSEKIAAEFIKIEDQFTNEVIDYLDLQTVRILDLQEVREILRKIQEQTGVKTALLYATFTDNSNLEDAPDDSALKLLLLTAELDPLLLKLPNISKTKVFDIGRQWLKEITNPRTRNNTSYLAQSQQLYQWLITPIEDELKTAEIDNLVLLTQSGLRSLPMAALHDGQKFLVEKYSLGLMPSISLVNTNYQSVQDAQVLAMGASEFKQHNSLPGVPLELSLIAETLWPGNSLLNPEFTLQNLKAERVKYPFEIIHLATHAQFQSGRPNNSYIQMWQDEQLTLDQMRFLNWDNPTVELLVLSACRTAVGDKNAELGFAGLAVASGAKSALASLWYVSDQATLGLMSEFYWHLKNFSVTDQLPIKAEAIRQAQLQMIRGNVKTSSDQLFGSFGQVPLSAELVGAGDSEFTHPYYWSAFTVIGSPW